MTVEEVRNSDGVLLAIFIRGSPVGYGLHFFTAPEHSLQAAWMRHPAGKIIDAHIHRPAARIISQISEVLYVRSGWLRVDLYGDDWEIQSRNMYAGDVAVLIAGGHGFEAVQEVEILEVRNGPYLGKDAEKVMLNPPVELKAGNG